MLSRARKIFAVPLVVGVAAIAVVAGASSSAVASSARSTSAVRNHAVVGSASAKKRQIVIGFPEDLTGELAVQGSEQLRGAELAVKSINASDPSVHVKLDVVDTQTSPTVAITAVQKLISEHVNGIVGFVLSEEGVAPLPLFAKSGVPTLELQVTLPTNRPKNVFTLAAPVNNYMPLTVTYGLKGTHAKSLAVIYQDNPTLQLQAAAVEKTAAKMGIKTVAVQGSALTQTDFSSQISAVLAKHPSVVATFALNAQTGTIAAGLRAAGFKGTIIAQQGAAIGSTFRQVAGSAAVGVVLGTSWDPAGGTWPAAKSFVKKYKAAYPTEPRVSFVGAEGWDGIHMMVDAIEKASGRRYSDVVKAFRPGVFDDTVMAPSIRFYSTGTANIGGMALVYTATGEKLLGLGGVK